MPDPDILLAPTPVERDPELAADYWAGLLSAIAVRPPAIVWVVPHLPYLPDDHRLWTHLRDRTRPLLVVSPLYPRAVRWLLAAHGVGSGGTQPAGVRTTGPAWLGCLRPQDHATPARLLAAMAAACPEAEPRELVRLDGPQTAGRWYPVLDVERCNQCGLCFEFCLFGVYAKPDGRVLVRHPDACKTGCPACARHCPVQAIIFPDYHQDPLVAGASAAELPDSHPLAGTGTAAPRDELDELISALDRLDRTTRAD